MLDSRMSINSTWTSKLLTLYKLIHPALVSKAKCILLVQYLKEAKWSRACDDVVPPLRMVSN